MKKFFSIFLMLLFLLTHFYCISEMNYWICQSCGNSASGNFCSNCGAKKPEIGKAEEANVGAGINKEITFNDFAWGMDAESALELLVSKKFIQYFPIVDNPVILSNWDWFWADHWDKYIDSGIQVWGGSEGTIAGYSLSEIHTYYYFDYDENGYYPTAKDSHLYTLYMVLEAIDYDYAEEDLVSKLTTLYGKPEKISNSLMYDGVSYIWYGANNTAVCLTHIDYDYDEDDEMYLTYGKTDSDAALKAVSQLVRNKKASEERKNSNNFDGLK